MSNKYTVYGNQEFEDSIEKWMQLIANRAINVAGENNIAAIILGGGYGRGEGGVIRCNDGTVRLYNDFDFFVITENVSFFSRRRINASLKALGVELSKQVGIDVDFSPVKNRAELPRLGFTMMWQELKAGHHMIRGNKNILDLVPDFDLNNLPLEELAKLMLNRGTGLILAEDRLRHGNLSHEDIDFVTRNIWKAVMACGDSFLALNHDFSSSYRQRAELMKSYKAQPQISDFFELYQASIDFKLRPVLPVAEDLPVMLLQAKGFFHRFYLKVFNACLGTENLDFPEVQQRLYETPLFPGNAGCSAAFKNFLLNILVVDRGRIDYKWSLIYPRSRLFVIFPDFFLDSLNKSKYICVLPGLCGKSTQADCLKSYLKLWNRFN